MSFPTVPLKHMAGVTLGKMLATSSEGDAAFPYLKASTLQEDGSLARELQQMAFTPSERETLSLRKGDVVVVEGGSIGRSVYLKDDLPGVFFQNSINRLRPRSGNDGRFINYAVMSLRNSGYFDAVTNQATIRHLTADKLANSPIPAPHQRLQHEIADYLDHETAEVDAFIADLNALSTLAAARTALVETSLFEQALKQSTRISKLSRHATVRSGLALDSTNLATEADSTRSVVVLGGNGVIGYTEEPLRTADSIVIGRVGALCGNVRLVRGPHWVTDNALVVDLRDSSIEIDYLARYLAYLKLNDRADRTAQPLITGGMVSSLPLPVPSQEMQRTLVEEIARRQHRLAGLMSDIDAAIELAKERRTALITAAVTGQIDVTTKRPAAVHSIQTAIEETR